jgi:dTDP-4-dehydrorhamnose 3,5-epimerase
MEIKNTTLQDVRIIEITPHHDERGYFARTMCMREFCDSDLEVSYPQHNTAFSRRKGTLRGMHFQVDPYYEVKVVRCIYGAVYDVIIDLRPHSSTYLQWEGYELSMNNLRQLYVPRGFAHGYQTLSDDTIVNYLCSAFYKPTANAGIRYDDPHFRIKWPLDVIEISQKDSDWLNFLPPSNGRSGA